MSTPPINYAEQVAKGCKQLNMPFAANDNIAAVLLPGDLEGIEKQVEEACRGLLRALVIDTKHDHNTQGTAKRMAKMFIHEVFRGRYEKMPDLKDFPNAKNLDEIYVVGPVTVRSACSHHFVPIMGKAWVGILPGERVVGLSKFARLANWIFRRPQIQEESTIQLADLLEEVIKPKGLAIIVDAQHMCMSWRGVEEPCTSMTTSVMRGAFLDNASAKAEFLSLIKLNK